MGFGQFQHPNIGEIDSGFTWMMHQIKVEDFLAICMQTYFAVCMPQLSGKCLKLPMTHTFKKQIDMITLAHIECSTKY